MVPRVASPIHFDHSVTLFRRSPLVETAAEIIEAGFTDPIIFELIGLLAEGIGADRISDMMARIILPDIARFTERVARQLHVPTARHCIGETYFNLPVLAVETTRRSRRTRAFNLSSSTRRILYLLPREILRPLPIANSWEYIDVVCAYNDRLRAIVNEKIGSTWRKATASHVKKADLKRFLLNNPEVLSDLIVQYKKKPPERYDFEKDPELELRWVEFAEKYAADFPLQLDASQSPTPAALLAIVKNICQRFGWLVENNNLWEILYDTSGKPRKERVAQRIFFAIAVTWCEANDIDISAESNAGRGPIDFKFSRGFHVKVNVEVKLSTNERMKHGFTQQLPAYNRAERAHQSLMLVIRVADSTANIDATRELREKAIQAGENVPDLIIIDGRARPSASKK